MAGKRKGGLPPDLAQVAARFAQWRRENDFGTRIPDPLWNSAADLAHRYGVSRTAQTLKLGYDRLKKRLQKKAQPVEDPGGHRSFLELSPAPLLAPSECTVEFEKADGSRMRIQLKGNGMPDLTGLGRAFWEEA